MFESLAFFLVLAPVYVVLMQLYHRSGLAGRVHPVALLIVPYWLSMFIRYCFKGRGSNKGRNIEKYLLMLYPAACVIQLVWTILFFVDRYFPGLWGIVVLKAFVDGIEAKFIFGTPYVPLVVPMIMFAEDNSFVSVCSMLGGAAIFSFIMNMFVIRNMGILDFKRLMELALVDCSPKTSGIEKGKFPMIRIIREGQAVINVGGFNLPRKDFVRLVPNLASHMACNITRVQRAKMPNTFQVNYTWEPFGNRVIPWHKAPFTDEWAVFPIGTDGVNWEYVNLRQKPHLLIYGKTRYGKSSFVRYLITAIATSVQDFIMVIADKRKAGTDFAYLKYDLREHEEFVRRRASGEIAENDVAFEKSKIKPMRNVIFATNQNAILHALKWISMEFYRRVSECDMNDVGNIFVLNDPSRFDPPVYYPPVFFVMDEASASFLSSDSISKEASAVYQDLVEGGGAYGIHVIMITQRPSMDVVKRVRMNFTGIGFLAGEAEQAMVFGKSNSMDIPDEPGVFIHAVKGGHAYFMAPWIEEPDVAPIVYDKSLNVCDMTKSLCREARQQMSKQFDNDWLIKLSNVAKKDDDVRINS